MALQEQLQRFKQQQEKCQSTLSSINTARAAGGSGSSSRSVPHHKSKPIPIATSSSIAAKAPAVKFSNDTERLQHINSIRKAPVGAQIKRVIDLLFETREAWTAEQINDVCYVDAINNKQVFNNLTNNPKVSYDGRRFSYKPTYDIQNKKELLHLIRKSPEGMHVNLLKDGYPTVLDDLQALKASGDVWLLSNFDSQEDVVYPNDPKITIKVDDDLKLLFRGIELPRDMIDIEKDLQKNGMKPATNTAKRRAMAQVHGITPKPKTKKKTRDISKRTKLTNAHLPELFKNIP
ncbi:hypothetical protein MKW94_024830 [Papaver nudicaule]|uniref:Transcription initiation factor IIE subunit beta n=1 Tax=Papaver nudicaule TaxID=74823 RepID=A0AA41V4J0_PAPNU|nr:hypothetical protein [Papaver nudicaule]MCL7030531.1 hypothetical protein [Papaver nudicaule]